MPRYVILQHDHPERHWDLMLEWGEVLRTWKLTSPPGTESAIPAQKSFDHRPIYLDYEGPISGGRGAVIRWDSGNYQLIAAEDDRMALRINGARLNGRAIFERDSDGLWQVVFQSESAS